MAKIGTWLIGVGCFVALFGLTMIPAATASGADKTVSGLCMLTFSFAMMIIAGGMYLKARAYQGTPESDAARRGRKATCDSCGKAEPAIQCRVHQLHLCPDCLATHYDFRSCAYAPSTRRATPKASSLSHASGL